MRLAYHFPVLARMLSMRHRDSGAAALSEFNGQDIASLELGITKADC
jgi:hypothetical protein